MEFTRDDISTTRSVAYRLTGDFPKWTVHRPGSYAKGWEHLAEEVLNVEKVTFHFGMAAGQWVLREITMSCSLGEGPDRRVHYERITGQSTGKMPWWLVKLAASAAQEPWA